jgi:hypothetical protein
MSSCCEWVTPHGVIGQTSRGYLQPFLNPCLLVIFSPGYPVRDGRALSVVGEVFDNLSDRTRSCRKVCSGDSSPVFIKERKPGLEASKFSSKGTRNSSFL